VQFRVTEPEVDVILRALRTTTTGAMEARRLADTLAQEVAVSGGARSPGRRGP
jgi:hypothetical protein